MHLPKTKHQSYTQKHKMIQLLYSPNQLCVSAYLRSGHGGSRLSKVFLDVPLPSYIFQFLLGDPEAFPDQMSYTIPLGLPSAILIIKHARKISKGRHPGGILVRCSDHLHWHLSTQRSSNSTPSSFQMSELLTLYLRLSSAIL